MKQSKTSYPSIIRPLTHEEGGGYLIEYPDLPGCIADGETPEEALSRGKDAIQDWIQTALAHGDTIPSPHSDMSGKWQLRLPKSLHASLKERARYEGVSLNTLVSTMLAKSMGRYSTENLSSK